jgi:threonine/homoserine efflux transporter RhtA
MATRRRLQFIQAQVAWMLAVVVVLALLSSLELELFFVLSLIGFLVFIELTAPIAVTPTWRRRLPWFIAIGLVVFGIIVVRRIIEILPPGVFG